MTLIEFFDKTAAENLVTALATNAERIILLGRYENPMKVHKKRYQQVFEGRNRNTEILYRAPEDQTLAAAMKLLQEIVDTYPDCAFDITGGDELFLVALGRIYEQNKDKHIQIQRVDLKKNNFFDIDKDGEVFFQEIPTLSIKENICIYGGEVIEGDINSDRTYKWDMSEDFLIDIEKMWQFCHSNPKLWNVYIGTLEEASKADTKREDGLSFTAQIEVVKQKLAKKGLKFSFTDGFLRFLYREGLITNYSKSENEISVTFKNSQVKKCLTKAGQVFEMKVFSLAMFCMDEQGEKVYDDVMNGVYIDWDRSSDHPGDTHNEIDVLMMHDMIPVFVSCKNGKVTSEELYKLSSVANRFGGEYAKKVLVATSLHDLPDGGYDIRKRAHDMQIRIIEKPKNNKNSKQTITDEWLCREIETMWSRNA